MHVGWKKNLTASKYLSEVGLTARLGIKIMESNTSSTALKRAISHIKSRKSVTGSVCLQCYYVTLTHVGLGLQVVSISSGKMHKQCLSFLAQPKI